MLCGASMRLLLAVLFLALTGSDGKSRRRVNQASSENEIKKSEKSPSTTPIPAIVAIEIIDPNENKTSNKNSKRTIESSLGYGFQSLFGATPTQPKFQIYKYSQHDIPGVKGRSPVSTQNFQITKSVSYDLGTQTQQKYTSIQPSLVQYYKPGTTLYSTINNQGQLAGLSSQIPYQQSHAAAPGPIPVIILRVHPDHLKNPNVALYPQLPQSNPYSGNLNSINIQSLLSGYIENMLKKIKVKTAYPTKEQNGQQQYQGREYLPVAPQASQGSKYLPAASPQVKYLPPAIAQLAYKQAPQQEVYQVPQQQEVYQQVPPQQVVYQQEYQQPTEHQSYDQQSYQQHVYQQPVYQQQSAYQQQEIYPSYQSQVQYEQPQYHRAPTGHGEYHHGSDLLTHENYPSDAHTRVIFRSEEGHIRTTTKSPKYTSTPTETRVIKITYPSKAFSSVEVKTPETQYAYTPGPEPSQKVYYEDAENIAPPQYYYTQGEEKYQVYQHEAPVPKQVNYAQEPVQQHTDYSQQASYPQQEASYAQQEARYAQQQANYAQEQASYASQQDSYAQQPAQYVTQAPPAQVVIQPKGKQTDRPTRRSRSKKPIRIVTRQPHPVKENTEELEK